MAQSKEKRGVGVNTFSRAQYTDHLAVICQIMDVPLIYYNEADAAQATHFYPQLNTKLIDPSNFTPEYLFNNYDVLFISERLAKEAFHQQFGALEQKLNKQMRHVFCPHGFSDKGFFHQFAALEDICLVYGQNMLDQLKHLQVHNLLGTYVITGNYRYTYYKQHQAFYDALTHTEIAAKFPRKQPIILYAPTLHDIENTTTFFDCHADIIDNLPDTYNLIVKPHPRLHPNDIEQYASIVSTYSDRPNILFIKDFLPIYPLLALADIYLGDTSSIGYDFLTFDKPMFFINKLGLDPESDRRLYLFRTGTIIAPNQLSSLYKLIEKNLPSDDQRFSGIRKEVYAYTFGKEKPLPQIKEEIIAAYNN